MCRIKESRSGFTFVELMVASSISSLVVLAAIAFAIYAARSYSAMGNYSQLDQQGQLALDKFTQQVRQVNGLTSYSTNSGGINSLTFKDYDGQPLKFTYDPNARSLYRIKAGITNVLLSGCDALQFTLYQRTPQALSFDAVSTAVATNCKLVEVNWSCSRNVLAGDKANTELVQSAKVAIRSN